MTPFLKGFEKRAGLPETIAKRLAGKASPALKLRSKIPAKVNLLGNVKAAPAKASNVLDYKALRKEYSAKNARPWAQSSKAPTAMSAQAVESTKSISRKPYGLYKD